MGTKVLDELPPTNVYGPVPADVANPIVFPVTENAFPDVLEMRIPEC